jgi:hypothetical protein
LKATVIREKDATELRDGRTKVRSILFTLRKSEKRIGKLEKRMKIPNGTAKTLDSFCSKRSEGTEKVL